MKNMITLLVHTKLLFFKKRGSITLEAALVFPLLVFLFLFFYMIIFACTIQMTMKSVAYTTVSSIASHIHAVDKVGQVVKQNLNNPLSHSSITESNQSSNEFERQLLALIPEPIYSIIVEGKKGNWWPTVNLATTVVGKQLVEHIVLQLPESRGLDADRLSLVYLQLPDIVNYTDATVKLTLQYEFPFKVPLINKRFVIREQASQRAWLPDARSSNFAISDDDMFIQVISITPTPLRPGNKARITVKTKPNAELNISIIYKSGTSVARNLGQKVADEKGEISWEWLVSGNTTPGIWQYDISEIGGNAKANGVFEVRKKGDSP